MVAELQSRSQAVSKLQVEDLLAWHHMRSVPREGRKRRHHGLLWPLGSGVFLGRGLSNLRKSSEHGYHLPAFEAELTRALPVFINRKTLQLKRRVDLNDTIDLTVRVLVVLSSIHLLRVEVHCRQTHVQVVRQGQLDSSAAVLWAVKFAVRNPTFLQTLLDVLAEVLVVGVVRTVISVESFLECFSRGATDRSIWI
jgi:hypothetical protein